MVTADQFIAELQRIGPTVRRGYTRDGQPVSGYGIWLDNSTYIRNGYVWVQQAPPYNYVVPVHHCGITLGVVAQSMGLQGWYNSAWTPSGADGFRRAGRFFDVPQRGDWAYINYGGGIITHVGCVVDPSGFGKGTVDIYEFNTDASGTGRLHRRPTWMVVGYGRPLYSTVEVPQPEPEPEPVIVPVITTLLQPKDDDMTLIAEIYRDGDLTGDGPVEGAVPERHEAYIPGFGWERVTNGNYTEANGFRRVRYTESEFTRLGLAAVTKAVTMAEVVAAKLKEQA